MPSDITFEQAWRRVLLHAPECPVPLAQEFVNTAYSRLLSRYAWTGTRAESEIYVPPAYDLGTANVLQGSATVTAGGAAVWDATMIGKQFYVNGIAPFYTIIDVPTASTLTLDRVYGGATATAQVYDILYIYAVMPTDFGYFETVRDPVLNWRLRLDVGQRQIDAWDAKRTLSGLTWILAPATYSPVTSTLGQVRYEMWPKTNPGPKQFLYRYIKKIPLLSAATDRPVFPIRGDVLMAGALAELALWPGTSTYKNPFHDMIVHKTYADQFERYTNWLIREENETNQQTIFYDSWLELPFAPIDAKFLQQTEIFF